MNLSTWEALILAFVITAAVSDLMWRTIPRYLSLVAVVAGLAFHGANGAFFSSLTAALLGFVAGVLLFHLGAIGGGDVKLITALGAMLGLPLWLTTMQFAVLIAGLIGLVQVLRRGLLRQTLWNIAAIIGGWFRHGFRSHPEFHVGNPSMARAPMAVAAALAFMVALFYR